MFKLYEHDHCLYDIQIYQPQMSTRWVLWYLDASPEWKQSPACPCVCTSLEVLGFLALVSQFSLLTHGSLWFLLTFLHPPSPKSSSKLDDEIWELISNFSKGPPASLFSSSSSSASSFPVRTSGSAGHSSGHARVPPLPPSALQASVWASGPHPGAPGRSPYLTTVKVMNSLSGVFHFS